MNSAWNQIEISSKLWFDNVPEPIRFMTAAGLGNIAFFNIDRAFYQSIVVPLAKDTHRLFQKNKETISFFFSYLIQVGFQHFLNAALVYGLDTISTAEKYIDTLILTYSSYSLSLIGSTIGNGILIGQGVPKHVAFWSTILSFGMVNFFLLRFLMGGFVERGECEKDVQDPKLNVQLEKSNQKKIHNQKSFTNHLRSDRFRGGGQSQSMSMISMMVPTRMMNYFTCFVMMRVKPHHDDASLDLVTRLGPKVCYDRKDYDC
jgi:putative Mn2+ efflux pump MntP